MPSMHFSRLCTLYNEFENRVAEKKKFAYYFIYYFCAGFFFFISSLFTHSSFVCASYALCQLIYYSKSTLYIWTRNKPGLAQIK